ncbi:MAG: C-GCAxxG-C-C family protein [Thermotogota bacterium]|nr:C-GCAxxG-C-C family protein [Thermotogota bacterium]
MGVESVCGALTGGVAVLGVMFASDKSLGSESRKTIVADFYKAFEKRFGSDNCQQIKDKFSDDTLGCQNVVK